MGISLVEERVATDAGKVQVFRGGAGDPLVYLHSAQGEGSGLLLLEDLAQHFHVMAPMFPGFGESEGMEKIDDMEDAVFHLLDLFSRLGIDHPLVVGLSLGGWMAAELATRYPDRVGGLVLVNPAGLHIPGAPIKEIFGRTPAQLAEDLFYDQSHPMASLMHQMTALAEQPAQLPFEVVKPILQSMAATARLGWDPYLHNPKLRKRLHRITVPTLVVHGAADRLIPRAHAEAYAADIPGARLVDVQEAGHLIPLEKPAELAALIREHATVVTRAPQPRP